MATTTPKLTIARAAQARDKPARAYEVRAERPMGLLIRVQPSGARSFYVQIGRAKRIRLGRADVMTLKQAEEAAKRVLLDPHAASRHQRSVNAVTTLREYTEGEFSQHATARTKTGHATVARVLAQWPTLLDCRMTDITAEGVDKLRNKRLLAGVAPATINRDVFSLSAVFSHWSRQSGHAHPFRGKLPPLRIAADEKIRYLTSEEERRLRGALVARDAHIAEQRASANAWRAARHRAPMPVIAKFGDHLTPMVLLSLATGIRQGELFSLTWEVIDLRLKTLTVLASHAKGNTTRSIPLNIEAVEVINAIKPRDATGLVFKSPKTGGRFTGIKNAWGEVTKAAQLRDFRWHDLRHTFASRLVQSGVSLFVVQRLLGHATPAMTQRYARLSPRELADAVAVLDAPVPPAAKKTSRKGANKKAR